MRNIQLLRHRQPLVGCLVATIHRFGWRGSSPPVFLEVSTGEKDVGSAEGHAGMTISPVAPSGRPATPGRRRGRTVPRGTVSGTEYRSRVRAWLSGPWKVWTPRPLRFGEVEEGAGCWVVRAGVPCFWSADQ